MSDGEVTFQWKDYRDRDRHKPRRMTLAADEFIRRLLIHTAPPRFPRIRYYGLLANRHREAKLALCRELLSLPAQELLPEPGQCRQIEKILDRKPPTPCPKCRKREMIRLGFVAAYYWSARPPDTS